MKTVLKLCLLAALFIGVYLFLDRLSSAKPLHEYKKYAYEETWNTYQADQDRFGVLSFPSIMDIRYKLDSSELVGEGQLRLVVTEVVEFEYGAPPDDRRLRISRHNALMQETEDGNWEVVTAEKELMTTGPKQFGFE